MTGVHEYFLTGVHEYFFPCAQKPVLLYSCQKHVLLYSCQKYVLLYSCLNMFSCLPLFSCQLKEFGFFADDFAQQQVCQSTCPHAEPLVGEPFFA